MISIIVFYLALAPQSHGGNRLDEVRIQLSWFWERLSGGEALRKSPSIYKPRELEIFLPVFKIFQKIFSAACKPCRAVWIWPPAAPLS